MRYEIPGDPIPWTAARVTKTHSYNPNGKQKKAAKSYLSIQHQQRPLFTGAVRCDFFFEVRPPKSLSKRTLNKILSGEKIYCTKRPDRTNYLKFAEDCLTGSVLSDDNIVVTGISEKYYAQSLPRTLIEITELEP